MQYTLLRKKTLNKIDKVQRYYKDISSWMLPMKGKEFTLLNGLLFAKQKKMEALESIMQILKIYAP